MKTITLNGGNYGGRRVQVDLTLVTGKGRSLLRFVDAAGIWLYDFGVHAETDTADLLWFGSKEPTEALNNGPTFPYKYIDATVI